jgi:uncharacterized protein (UPF0332 family)
MSFNWDEYFTLALELAGISLVPPGASEEARLRAAISRAYYALYHAALAVAQRRDGYVEPTISLHSALISHYRFHPDSTVQPIGDDLRQLRNIRAQADYQSQPPSGTFNRDDVLMHLQLAEHLLARLAAL